MRAVAIAVILAACGDAVTNPIDAGSPDSSVEASADALVQDTSVVDAPVEAIDPCLSVVSCATYCDAIASACNAEGVTCKALCPYLPASAIDCRTTNACARKCAWANVWSDACGAPCETFCTIELAVCTNADAQYLGTSDCLAKCGAWAVGTPGDSSGNSRACREYHLGVAALAKPNASTHCPHTADVSSACN